MAIRVRVRRNWKRGDLATEAQLSSHTTREAGERKDRRAPVRERTARGLDEEGHPFAGGADGQPVDLQATGQMLADLEVIEATETGVRVGFRTERSARLAALHEQGISRMPARRSSGLSEAMLKVVAQFIKTRDGKVKPQQTSNRTCFRVSRLSEYSSSSSSLSKSSILCPRPSGTCQCRLVGPYLPSRPRSHVGRCSDTANHHPCPWSCQGQDWKSVSSCLCR